MAASDLTYVNCRPLRGPEYGRLPEDAELVCLFQLKDSPVWPTLEQAVYQIRNEEFEDLWIAMGWRIDNPDLLNEPGKLIKLGRNPSKGPYIGIWGLVLRRKIQGEKELASVEMLEAYIRHWFASGVTSLPVKILRGGIIGESVLVELFNRLRAELIEGVMERRSADSKEYYSKRIEKQNERRFNGAATRALIEEGQRKLSDDDDTMEIIRKEGWRVGTHDWDSGGPAGGGTLEIYEYKNHFFSDDEIELYGPLKSFSEAASAIGFFTETDATTEIWITEKYRDQSPYEETEEQIEHEALWQMLESEDLKVGAHYWIGPGAELGNDSLITIYEHKDQFYCCNFSNQQGPFLSFGEAANAIDFFENHPTTEIWLAEKYRNQRPS